MMQAGCCWAIFCLAEEEEKEEEGEDEDEEEDEEEEETALLHGPQVSLIKHLCLLAPAGFHISAPKRGRRGGRKRWGGGEEGEERRVEEEEEEECSGERQWGKRNETCRTEQRVDKRVGWSGGFQCAVHIPSRQHLFFSLKVRNSFLGQNDLTERA